MNKQGAIIMQGSGRTFRKMPDRMYKTYQVAAPIDTHTRQASCEEIGCNHYTNGWTFKKSDLIGAELYELVTKAGKRYREMKLDDSPEIYLVFEPGQPCFQAATHRISLERPQFFFAGRGAGSSYSPRRATQFNNGEEWADSFANHQAIINKVREEGI